MKVIDKDISKKDLFDKLSKISQSDLKKLNLNNNEINYLKHKILNDKLGLVLNFEEKDEFLDNHYFGLEEVKELHINPKDKNNHLLIEGDNYYALKTLQLSGIKVDVIYIDPPYNTGNKDFVYNDNFVEKDDQFKHSKWLSFMKKRLILARELLADDGVIFVSIDDNEQAYLKVLMDEIFGEENFVANLIQDKRNAQNDNKMIEKNHEYIVMFCKMISKFEINKKFVKNEKKGKTYSLTIGATGGGLLINRNKLGWTLYFNPKSNDKIPIMDYSPQNVNENSNYKNLYIDDKSLIEKGYIPIRPPYKNGRLQRWTWNIERAKEKIDKIIPKQNNKNNEWNLHYKDERNEKPLAHKSVLCDFPSSQGTNIMNKIGLKFDNPKNSELIKFLIDKHKDSSALILDFFAGSGTTGQAVMELNEEDGGNRRFILCTNNENNIAKDITRERIYRVINGEGSKGQKIDWQYSKDKKSLKNNSVKYLIVKSINKYDGQYEEIDDMKKIYKNEFNKELSIKDFK